MPHLLFVCTGNICRSPFAELLAGRLAGPDTDWTFGSAGLAALVGEPMDRLMAAELGRRGVDASGFAARQLDRTLASSADLVLCMERAQRTRLLDDSPGIIRRTFTLSQFASEAAQQPELSGLDLVRSAGHLQARFRAGDVLDPYRRGPEAAAETASRIERLVEMITRALRH